MSDLLPDQTWGGQEHWRSVSDDRRGSAATTRKVTMPKKLERELEKEADKKGLTGEARDAYIYGTMRKTGWKPKREKGKK